MRPLSETFGLRREAEPAFAGLAQPSSAQPPVLLRGERARLERLWSRFRFDRPPPTGLGLGLTIALLLFVAGFGAVRGGQYQAFVATEGSVGDFLARNLGFGVNIVTLSGQSRLTEAQVLSIAGISPKNSLPFFDVEAARARLEAVPLVKQASVRKLYPGQIVIELIERQPAGLWQKDGEVRAIAADGAPIDELHGAEVTDLPFVVGDGANGRLNEFLGLLGSLDELRTKVAAGVLIGGRRWNLHMKSGLDVKLPELDPAAAIKELLRLQRESRVLDRDLVWLDLREPGRVFARLSAEAAAARAEELSHVKKGGGAQ